MEKCTKCERSNFVKRGKSNVVPTVEYLLCSCGNVMIKHLKTSKVMPTPEVHGPLTMFMIEDAAKALGLPSTSAVLTEEELRERCEQQMSDLLNSFIDEEDEMEDYEEDIYDEVDSFDEEDYDCDGNCCGCNDCECDCEDDEEEIYDRISKISELIAKKLSNNFELERTTDSDEDLKSYIIVEKDGGWRTYVNISKEEMTKVINEENTFEEFLVFEINPVDLEVHSKYVLV